jgi:hypothetical protein
MCDQCLSYFRAEVRPEVMASFGYDGGIVRLEILDASKHVADPLRVTLAVCINMVQAYGGRDRASHRGREDAPDLSIGCPTGRPQANE